MKDVKETENCKMLIANCNIPPRELRIFNFQSSSWFTKGPFRFHARRASGRYRHHRDINWAVAAGPVRCPRVQPPRPLRQQSQATRHGLPVP